MSQSPEDYRKKPIYGTDFSKELSQIIEMIRGQMVQSRGHISDIEFGYPGWKERVEHVGGLLTCGIIALAYAKDEITKFEIARDDAKIGPSYSFNVRGIGLDICPGCFVCGSLFRSIGANAYLNNIAKDEDRSFPPLAESTLAHWVDSQAELSCRTTQQSARHLPSRSQTPALEILSELTSVHGHIRKTHIDEARSRCLAGIKPPDGEVSS